MNALPKLKPTSTLPAIIAFLGTSDSGEYGNARCPHCNAEGRYVHTFICEDGTRRGAMSGCIQLFPQSRDRYSKLAMEAYKRSKQAKEEGRNLASWWADMVAACESLGDGAIGIDEWRFQVGQAESRRQAWLSKNGYSYSRRGRR